MPKKPTETRTPADTVTVDIDLTATEAAWRKHEARARALPAKEVNAARLDVTVAASIALVGARSVIERRDELAAAFRDPPLAVIERMPEVCLAAQHADLLHRAALDPAAPFIDLLPRLNELRGYLLDDLAAQVRRKRCPAKVLDDVRAGDNTVRDKANDLNDLAAWYRANWSKVSGKTTVEAEEIAEAGKLATAGPRAPRRRRRRAHAEARGAVVRRAAPPRVPAAPAGTTRSCGGTGRSCSGRSKGGGSATCPRCGRRGPPAAGRRTRRPRRRPTPSRSRRSLAAPIVGPRASLAAGTRESIRRDE